MKNIQLCGPPERISGPTGVLGHTLRTADLKKKKKIFHRGKISGWLKVLWKFLQSGLHLHARRQGCVLWSSRASCLLFQPPLLTADGQRVPDGAESSVAVEPRREMLMTSCWNNYGLVSTLTCILESGRNELVSWELWGCLSYRPPTAMGTHW